MKFKSAVNLIRKHTGDAPVLRRSDLRVLFDGDSDRAFTDTLERLVFDDALSRMAAGVYAIPDRLARCDYPIEEVAGVLRRGSHSYVSLETALSEYGIISQIPTGWVTLMTTGRKGVFETSLGGIEFVHTARTPLEIYDGIVRRDGRPLPLARPEIALADLGRASRNMHLVDRDVLEEVLDTDDAELS